MPRRKVSLAHEGARIIALSAILVVVAVAFSLLVGGGKGLWLPAVISIWFLAVVFFFRDPQRFPPRGESLIVSPADGKVISIGDAIESPLNPAGMRISVFMSLLNVHVNRAPFDGIIESSIHRQGKFKVAFKPSASIENECVEVIHNTVHGKLGYRLIAGFLARRIAFHPKSGDKLKRGQRIGMIRFGSRVDLFLPRNTRVNVFLGEKVIAGETIIGEFVDL